MQYFTELFNLPFEPFRSFVRDHDLVVSGNIATIGYFRQENLNVSMSLEFIIWSPHRMNEKILLDFFDQYKYRVISTVKFNNISGSWYETEYRLLNFENLVQKIIIKISRDNDVRFIQQTICSNAVDSLTSWWNSQSDRFETSYPELTKSMKVFRKNLVRSIFEPEPVFRIDYYESRGFTVIDEIDEEKCKYLVVEDDRKELDEDPFDGKKAFELISYEDVVISDFLRESSWHMILQVGETFYAFHRKHLEKMLRDHSMSFSGLIILDTPYRQSITNDVLSVLCFSDYSIMELVHEYNVSINGAVKSMYRVNFSTLFDWRRGEAGYVSIPPR